MAATENYWQDIFALFSSLLLSLAESLLPLSSPSSWCENSPISKPIWCHVQNNKKNPRHQSRAKSLCKNAQINERIWSNRKESEWNQHVSLLSCGVGGFSMGHWTPAFTSIFVQIAKCICLNCKIYLWDEMMMRLVLRLLMMGLTVMVVVNWK